MGTEGLPLVTQNHKSKLSQCVSKTKQFRRTEIRECNRQEELINPIDSEQHYLHLALSRNKTLPSLEFTCLIEMPLW